MRTRLLPGPLLVALCAAFVAAGPAGAAEDTHTYVTEPSLEPPVMIVNTSLRGQAPGYIFVTNFLNKFTGQPILGQPGPMILDNQGRVVWFKPYPKTADIVNLQVQRYRGKPVLTWWDGKIPIAPPSFDGVFNIANDRYKIIAQVKPTDGWKFSLHEIFITSRGTALVSASKNIPADLRPIGGAENGTLTDSGVLEYDIETGKLVREWSAFAHIPLEQSFVRTTPENTAPVDAYRINSIDEDATGNWLLSARNAFAIYKVDKNGNVLFRLGGKGNEFAMPDAARFAFQHDARFHPNGQISLFDNDCCALIPQPNGSVQPGPPVFGHTSRGLMLKVDEIAKTASLVFERRLPYNPPPTAGTQGNMQIFSNGNAMIGWGQQPFISEHDKAGKLVLAMRFPDPNESYRAYRFKWTGNPTQRPRAAARATGNGTRVFMSWNGATRVAGWRVFAGRTGREPAKTVRHSTFEDSTTIRTRGPRFKVQALDSKGRVLGTSRVVRRAGNTQGTEPAPVY